MTYSKNAPFRADVVGSYLRPDELKQARADYAAGIIDAAGLKAVEDRLITDLVAKQKPPACMSSPMVNSVAAGGISTSCGASTAWTMSQPPIALPSMTRSLPPTLPR